MLFTPGQKIFFNSAVRKPLFPDNNHAISSRVAHVPSSRLSKQHSRRLEFFGKRSRKQTKTCDCSKTEVEPPVRQPLVHQPLIRRTGGSMEQLHMAI
jgi:hypothetical protein